MPQHHKETCGWLAHPPIRPVTTRLTKYYLCVIIEVCAEWAVGVVLMPRNRPDATKPERFAEFLRRLATAPTASDFDEGYRQLGDILNAVEDELTSIAFDPDNWQTDGRMYPPQMDSLRSVPGRPDVKRFRSKQHSTLIGDNGAIEIRDGHDGSIFTKPGADGQTL